MTARELVNHITKFHHQIIFMRQSSVTMMTQPIDSFLHSTPKPTVIIDAPHTFDRHFISLH
jgi:hypothetical protein